MGRRPKSSLDTCNKNTPLLGQRARMKTRLIPTQLRVGPHCARKISLPLSPFPYNIPPSLGARCSMMGEGFSGCRRFVRSLWGPAHFSWEYTIDPGAFAADSAIRASPITHRCTATSTGNRRVWPKGNSTPTVRGTPTFSANPCHQHSREAIRF